MGFPAGRPAATFCIKPLGSGIKGKSQTASLQLPYAYGVNFDCVPRVEYQQTTCMTAVFLSHMLE